MFNRFLLVILVFLPLIYSDDFQVRIEFEKAKSDFISLKRRFNCFYACTRKVSPVVQAARGARGPRGVPGLPGPKGVVGPQGFGGQNGPQGFPGCDCQSHRFFRHSAGPEDNGKEFPCDLSPFDSIALCKNKKTSNEPVCSGRGRCICGFCFCDRPEDRPNSEIGGKYCECDNYNCPKFNNQICGGRGFCECNKCRCDEQFVGEFLGQYVGDACQCHKNQKKCDAFDYSKCIIGFGFCPEPFLVTGNHEELTEIRNNLEHLKRNFPAKSDAKICCVPSARNNTDIDLLFV